MRPGLARTRDRPARQPCRLTSPTRRAIRTARAVIQARPDRFGSAFNIEARDPATDDDRSTPRPSARSEKTQDVTWWYVDPLLKGSYPAAYLDQEATLRADGRPAWRPGHDRRRPRLHRGQRVLPCTWSSSTLIPHAPGLSAICGARAPGRRSTVDRAEFDACGSSRAYSDAISRYGRRPLYVTENGARSATAPGGRMDCVHDDERIAYLRRPPQPACPGAGRGLRRPRLLRLVAAGQLRMGGRVSASASGSCGCDLEGDRRRIVKDSGSLVAGLSPGPARSTTTNRSPERSARSGRP